MPAEAEEDWADEHPERKPQIIRSRLTSNSERA